MQNQKKNRHPNLQQPQETQNITHLSANILLYCYYGNNNYSIINNFTITCPEGNPASGTTLNHLCIVLP